MEKKIGLLGALLIVAACAPNAPERSTANLDNVLRTAVEQRRVPGVVAIVATADAVAYQGAFGINKDGIFAIASMTKPVTSVAVMQLVEAGKVKLDEPAATYLPELGTVQVLEGEVLRAPKTRITVRQLMTHTSGFGYEFLNRELHEYVAKGKVPSAMAGGDGFLFIRSYGCRRGRQGGERGLQPTQPRRQACEGAGDSSERPNKPPTLAERGRGAVSSSGLGTDAGTIVPSRRRGTHYARRPVRVGSGRTSECRVWISKRGARAPRRRPAPGRAPSPRVAVSLQGDRAPARRGPCAR